MGEAKTIDRSGNTLKQQFLKAFVRFFALLIFCHIIGTYTGIALKESRAYATQAYESLLEKFTRVEVVERFREPDTVALDELIQTTAREYRLPPYLLYSLVLQESGPSLRHDRMRYEPGLQSKFRRAAGMTDEEYRALATSWGYGQVIYGIWKDFCKLNSYADLLNPKLNLSCSASILRNCLDRRSGLGKSSRFRACLSEYNGDTSGRYAEQVLTRMAELVLAKQLS